MSNQTHHANHGEAQSIEIKDLALAWVYLVGLTLAGYVLSYLDGDILSKAGPLVIAALILIKARLILTRYLGLNRSPAWLAMLSSTIFVIMAISAGLLVFI